MNADQKAGVIFIVSCVGLLALIIVLAFVFHHKSKVKQMEIDARVMTNTPKSVELIDFNIKKTD